MLLGSPVTVSGRGTSPGPQRFKSRSFQNYGFLEISGCRVFFQDIEVVVSDQYRLDDSVAVDEECGRNRICGRVGNGKIVTRRNRINHLLLAAEWLEHGLHLAADPNHDEIILGDVGSKLIEMWNFLYTWTAPALPNIHDHTLAPEITEPESFSVDRRYREIGGFFTNPLQGFASL